MTRTPYPSLYQINTRILLQQIGSEIGRSATLDDIPDSTLDDFAQCGFDWIWLLGIWQTGPLAREISRTVPEWVEGYRRVLPDLRTDDITGSPFAIQSYTPHTAFGGSEALKRIRQRLKERGIRLLLDFVPNHTAPDHPWRFSHPEFFIHGSKEDATEDPGGFVELNTRFGPQVFAKGRDPYFPAWPDTLQLNYRHAGLRAEMIHTLLNIAEQCDGIRCDMAMLILPDVIAQTWANRSWPVDTSSPVDASFWAEAIQQIRQSHPTFLMMAEVYWDREWDLQQQGFDFTYDKRLYDRLRSRSAGSVRRHLWAAPEFQERSVRFLENHDEERAAHVFPGEVHPAAAVTAFLVPGLRFFHQGQFEGRQIHTSMHLGRQPEESVNPTLRDFYASFLRILRRPEFREGSWTLLDNHTAWDGNSTHENFLIYLWTFKDNYSLVVINFGASQAQCYVVLPAVLREKSVQLNDLLGPFHYERDGTQLATQGLYLDLPAWRYHIFELQIH